MQFGPSEEIEHLVKSMEALSLDPRTQKRLDEKTNESLSKQEVEYFLNSLPNNEQEAHKNLVNFIEKLDREIEHLLENQRYLLEHLADNKPLRTYVHTYLQLLIQNDHSEVSPTIESIIQDQFYLNAINMALIASQLSIGKSNLALSHCTRLPRIFLLSESFKTFREDIETLVLSSRVVQELPDEIDQLYNLHSLCVQGCSIEELPLGLSRLKALECLNVSKNNLKHLPDAIGSLTKLKEFDCSSNQLKTFVDSFYRLPHLERLDISSNKFCELSPQISKLDSLNYLNIAFNKIKSLPASIGALVQLCELNMMHNELKELPTEIGKLLALTKLNLSSNLLACLEPIRPLVELTFLDASRNQIPKCHLMDLRFDLIKLVTVVFHGNLENSTNIMVQPKKALHPGVNMRDGSLSITLGVEKLPSLPHLKLLKESKDIQGNHNGFLMQYESFKQPSIEEKPPEQTDEIKPKKSSSCILQ